MVATLEGEAQRLLALRPEAITAPRPPLTCALDTDLVLAAVATNFHSPITTPPPIPMLELKFAHIGANGQALDGGLKIRHVTQIHHAVSTCEPALQVGTTWKVRINLLAKTWIGLGVIGTIDAGNNVTYSAPTGHMWASTLDYPGQVYLAGALTANYGGWVGFAAGDVCIFKLERARLRMRVSRLGATIFEMPLRGAGPWYAHVNLYSSNDEAELLPVDAADLID